MMTIFIVKPLSILALSFYVQKEVRINYCRAHIFVLDVDAA